MKQRHNILRKHVHAEYRNWQTARQANVNLQNAFRGISRCVRNGQNFSLPRNVKLRTVETVEPYILRSSRNGNVVIIEVTILSSSFKTD